MGGAWLRQHLWEHYAFSEDKEFLARAYPAMREAAVFLLDYLVAAPNGRLVTCPSTSPKNSFLTADGAEAAVSAASTMDIWLARDLFRHCIAASEVLGVDEEMRSRLTTALGDLHEPQVAADGRLQEWWEDFGEPEPGHRHLSHLFCLYPGDEVAPRSAPVLSRSTVVPLSPLSVLRCFGLALHEALPGLKRSNRSLAPRGNGRGPGTRPTGTGDFLSRQYGPFVVRQRGAERGEVVRDGQAPRLWQDDARQRGCATPRCRSGWRRMRACLPGSQRSRAGAQGRGALRERAGHGL